MVASEEKTPMTPPGIERSPLVSWLAPRKPLFAGFLLLLGLIFLVTSGICFLRAAKASPKTDDTAEKKADDPLNLESTGNLGTNLAEYRYGGIAAFLAAALMIGSGGYLFGQLQLDTVEEQEANTRKFVLISGGGLGVVLMLFGLLLFIVWFSSLSKWVVDAQASEAWKVLTPLLVFLIGAGLLFLSVQPIRADVRNNLLLRRVAYGTNLGLFGLLLLLGLIVVNIFVGLKLPAKLDVTAEGFYSLSDSTKAYLTDLKQEIKVYSTFTKDSVGNPLMRRQAADLERLLEACRDVNPSKFNYKLISLDLNKTEIEKLKAENSLFSTDTLGVLLTLGNGPGQSTFIPANEFSERDPQGKEVFQGESKLISGMLFLTEDQDRTVYFTTGHGELEVIPPADGMPITPAKRAGALRTILEKSNSNVKNLPLEGTNPKVPEDAAVVVVANPQITMSPQAVQALQAYMDEPRSNGKKGKLVVMSSPFPKPDRSGVAETGLENLLGQYGVTLGRQYIYFQPLRDTGFLDGLVMISTDLIDNSHPIATSLLQSGGADGPIVRSIPMQGCRIVSTAPGGKFQARTLFTTYPPARVSWLEDTIITNPGNTLEQLFESPEVAQKKNATNRSVRPVAAIVSEAETSRMVVFGSGNAFGDTRGNSDSNPITELFATSVNWLRERPTAANVSSKTYGKYTPNPAVRETQLVYLPIGGVLLGIITLGLGVWAFRRK